MMTDELLPCPFCGGEAKLFHFSSAIRDAVWRVVCDKPFCSQGPDGYTEAEAVDAWNTRTDDYRQAAEYWQRMYKEAFAERTCYDTGKNEWHFVCSACGYEQNGYEQWNFCPNCGARVTKSDQYL